MERVLLYEEALEEVLNHANALGAAPALDRCELLLSQGRVLAQPILADRDQPPFPRSTRDGFAVRSADLESTVALRQVGTVRAGERWGGAPLQAGQTIEIMTGAPVPDGADAVLMVEHADIAGDGSLRPTDGRTLAAGENIVPTGAEARARTELVPPGQRIGTPEIGLAASCGYAHLEVFRSPRVTIVATGDELVEVQETPAPWQIRNSNSYNLASLVQEEGGNPSRLVIARDNASDLRDRIDEARDADLVLFSGGVSRGKYDLVEPALQQAGAEFFFTGARIQPGRPVVFGRLPGKKQRDLYFFGLPGNPISTEVCFRLFVVPMLRTLCGRSDKAPRFAEATLGEGIRGGAAVTRFQPAITQGDWRGIQARMVPWQGSGDLAANARANAFAVLPLGVERFLEGDKVRVLLR